MSSIMQAMVIEDHPLQQTVLEKALLRQKVGVTSYTSVDEAIEHPNIERIDVIFCDIQMPGKDGIDMMELLDKVRYPGKVVLVSAMETSIVSATRAMCEGFSFKVIGKLLKPFDAQGLSRLLDRVPEKTDSHNAGCMRDLSLIEQDFLSSKVNERVKNYYQPLMDAHTGEIVGYEALARWRHPIYGVLSPRYFLPLVEQHGFSGQLFDTVFNHVLQDIKQKGLTKKVSINVDNINLEQQDFAQKVIIACQENKVEPKQLKFEITERDTYQNCTLLYKNLLKLRLNGFTVSIDDFGTGFSSLERLSLLPFNELKIDRSFIRGIASSNKNRSIVKAICSLARGLNLAIVAEGVEDQATYQALKQFDIDFYQGYYIDKAMPLEAISILTGGIKS